MCVRVCVRACVLVSRSHTLTLARRGSGLMSSSQGMQLASAKIAVRARNAAIRICIDTAWSTKLVKAITTLLVELLPCFPAQSPPASDSKALPLVDSNHSLWLLTSHLTTLRLRMVLTKTSTNTDKSSSSQERPISLSPNLSRTTPFYFVTYCSFFHLIGLQYTLQREQPDVDSLVPSRIALTRGKIRLGTEVGAGCELRSGM